MTKLSKAIRALRELLEMHEATVSDQVSRLESRVGELDEKNRELDRRNQDLDEFKNPTTILVIDDDPGDVHLVRRLAEQVPDWPVEILPADSAEDALTLLARRTVDVVLVDYHLGAGSGLGVLRDLAQSGDRCRAVIMVTGQGDEEIAAEAMRSGALDYIAKSRLTSNVLHEAVCRALGKAELRRQVEDRREELLRLAHYDELTGLRDRRSFREWLEHEFKRSKRHGSPLSVLLLDVDEFKRVNDRYGHLNGDRVLSGIGSIIASMLRSTDAGGRLGGDEFCIAVVEQEIAGVRIFAERLRCLIERSACIHHEGSARGVTCSIGVACFERSMTATEQLLENAGRALYLSKAAGRNCVSVWESEKRRGTAVGDSFFDHSSSVGSGGSGT
jgi:diguanylate cyclase (GGDEF)-like protein